MSLGLIQDAGWCDFVVLVLKTMNMAGACWAWEQGGMRAGQWAKSGWAGLALGSALAPELPSVTAIILILVRVEGMGIACGHTRNHGVLLPTQAVTCVRNPCVCLVACIC